MWGDSSFVDVGTMDKSHKTACNGMIDYAWNLLRVIDGRGFFAEIDPMPTFLSCGDLDIFSIFSCSFVEDSKSKFLQRSNRTNWNSAGKKYMRDSMLQPFRCLGPMRRK